MPSTTPRDDNPLLRFGIAIWGLLAVVVSFTPCTVGAAADSTGILSISFENDFFTPANQDRHYTQGIRISYLAGEDRGWKLAQTVIRALPLIPGEAHVRVSYSLGQSAFTPEDINATEPVLDDRPYAGWLYLALGGAVISGNKFDSVELSIGMIGPSSAAGISQEAIHTILDGRDPKGWSNQLGNEFALQIFRERKWRMIHSGGDQGLQLDFMPHLGGSLGNILIYGSAGGVLRIGNDLLSDVGVSRIRPSIPGSEWFRPTKKFGWYVFGGFEGRGVGRNVFLDGNTFQSSQSVRRNPWVADFQAGAAIIRNRSRFAFTYVWHSREFEIQKGWDQFGAISYSIRF